MRSLATFALPLLASAAISFGDDETAAAPASPPLPNGKVLCVVVPRDAKLQVAELDFQYADGQVVTVMQGKALDEYWRLEQTSWSRDGKEAVITFRHDKKERRELRVPGELVARAGAQRAPRPLVEVQSRWYEVPAAAVGRVRDALEAAPTDDRLAFEMLRNALDGDAPPQLLTAAQFDELTQFLSTSADIDVIEAPGVTTKSGQRAVIEIIGEFRYPVEWESDATAAEPEPTGFATRNCGLTIEIEPTLKYGPLLELEITPQIVEFLGAKDQDNGTAHPYKPGAAHLPERAFNVATKEPFKVARPADYIFSARKERALVDVPPGYAVLLTGLKETEKIAPFEKTAPKGRLVVLVKVNMPGK